MRLDPGPQTVIISPAESSYRCASFSISEGISSCNPAIRLRLLKMYCLSHYITTTEAFSFQFIINLSQQKDVRSCNHMLSFKLKKKKKHASWLPTVIVQLVKTPVPLLQLLHQILTINHYYCDTILLSYTDHNLFLSLHMLLEKDTPFNKKKYWIAHQWNCKGKKVSESTPPPPPPRHFDEWKRQKICIVSSWKTKKEEFQSTSKW